MKRTLIALMCAMALPMVVVAQDDDMYFGKSRRQATKVTVVDADGKTEPSEHRTTEQRRVRGMRDVDEYNRRYRGRDDKADYGYQEDSQTTYYYEDDDRARYYTDEDYYYSSRLSRFYSPGLTISIGSPWYDRYYWGGYYDPFWDVSYYPWYSPRYYRTGWSMGWGLGWGYTSWGWPHYGYYDRWYGAPYYGHYGYYDRYYSYRPRTVAPYGGGRAGYSHVTSGRVRNNEVRVGTSVQSGARGGVGSGRATYDNRAVTNGGYSGNSRTAGGRVVTPRYSGQENSSRTQTQSAPTRSYDSRGSYSTPSRSNEGSYSTPSRSTTSSGGSGGGFSGGSRGARR